MEENTISIVLPVYNQQAIIDWVIKGIINNVSENVKELLIILDGCTDKSEDIIYKSLIKKPDWLNVKVFKKLVSEWEVLCAQTGFKNSSCKYSINVQDDMIIYEKNFDQRLLKPFKVLDKVFVVTGRDAANIRIKGNEVEFFDIVGKDSNGARNIFYQRQISNRGPWMVDNTILKELGYLNEEYAPITQDETEICLRASRKGYINGAYVINYRSDLSWGGTRKTQEVAQFVDDTQKRNMLKLIRDYKDLLDAPKINKDIIIEE